MTDWLRSENGSDGVRGGSVWSDRTVKMIFKWHGTRDDVRCTVINVSMIMWIEEG